MTGDTLPYTLEPVPLEQLPRTGNLLQTEYWGKLKQEFGHTPMGFLLRSADGADAPLLALVRPLAGGYSLAYIPHGPDVPGTSVTHRFLAAVAAELAAFLPKQCVFIRFDLPREFAAAGEPQAADFPGLVKAAEDIQPPSTVIVDLTLETDTILAGMKSKTRYNVRLAAKKGVVVDTSPADGGGIPRDFDEWYGLYRETAERDRIAIHSGEYYRRQFALTAEMNAAVPGSAPVLRLFTARHEKEILAGIITAAEGTRATYLYGASSNRKRNLMPAYALQWAAMTWAKNRGCAEYDLFGIPPAEDPAHPMHGLYRFKTGFGGVILHRPGCWDYPVRPALYAVFRKAEHIRRYYYKRFKKK